MQSLIPRQCVLLFCALHGGMTLAHSELIVGDFQVEFNGIFRGRCSVLAATDRFLFVSDSGPAPDDHRPDQVARQADDGSILGYSPEARQSIIRLLVCDRATGAILHEFAGPVSRKPRVSGFELPLTSGPVLLEDGFVFLTADWHLQRIRLPDGEGDLAKIWDIDIPTRTNLTPRLHDDIGYLMPAVTRCGDTLLFTFNSALADETFPLHLTMVAVDLADGELRWVRTLGPGSPPDRSPTCVPLTADTFAVVTATGDVQTFSLDGVLLNAFRPTGEYRPGQPAWWFGGGHLWELVRIGPEQIIAISGQPPEFGGEALFPLIGLKVDAQGRIETQWQSEKLHESVAGTAASRGADGNLYLRSYEGLTAFSRDSGQQLWDQPSQSATIDCAWVPPVVHEGFVYLATGDGIEVYRDGPKAEFMGVAELHTRNDRRPNSTLMHMPSQYTAPVIHDDIVYIAASDRVIGLKLPLFPADEATE